MTPGPADIAGLRWRLLALAIDAAAFAAAALALMLAANAALGPITGPVFALPWREATPVEVKREVTGREHDLGADGTRILRENLVESRRFADGSVRVVAVLAATLTRPDGTVETLREELEIGRDLGALIRLRLTQALLILGPFAYLAAMEASRLQGSLGKLALGLRVVDEAGARLRPGRAMLRQLFKALEVGGTGLGYALGVLTGDGRALHDRLSRTYVVHSPLRPPLPAADVARA